MPWYAYAITAAVVWGIHYNLLARAMTTISPISAYWLPTIIMLVGLPFFGKTLWEDYSKVLHSTWDVKTSVALIMFTSLIASLSLYKAIQLHNPVHAGLIEITYPVFVTIFAFALFGQNNLNWSTALGGALILAGAGIIIYFNG